MRMRFTKALLDEVTRRVQGRGEQRAVRLSREALLLGAARAGRGPGRPGTGEDVGSLMPSNPASSGAKFASSSAAERLPAWRGRDAPTACPPCRRPRRPRRPTRPSRRAEPGTTPPRARARGRRRRRGTPPSSSATRASKRLYKISSAGRSRSGSVRNVGIALLLRCLPPRGDVLDDPAEQRRRGVQVAQRRRPARSPPGCARRPPRPASTAAGGSGSAFARNPRGVEVMLAAGAGAGAEAWSAASPEVWSAVVPPMARPRHRRAPARARRRRRRRRASRPKEVCAAR